MKKRRPSSMRNRQGIGPERRTMADVQNAAEKNQRTIAHARKGPNEHGKADKFKSQRKANNHHGNVQGV